MYLMLQQDHPDDYVIATGSSHKLEEFVAEVFSYLGLNWREHVEVDSGLFRPTDIAVSQGNAAKAKAKLDWQAKYSMREVAQMMVDAV
jgi:GDPmannose 4,6-dehydratase